jgi:hypothetical protein
VARLRHELGDALLAVWLYGSRARGDPPGDESDVDLLVITRAGRGDQELVDRAAWDVATETGMGPFLLSTQVFDTAWLEDRRRIDSFFIREVDRDRVVLAGAAL